ncbi:hypothetical protein MES4922_20037 [Mesorhizobium ventifaucium]|uniref:Transposase IS4-like domain-containing protein n=1 Tax=Mesorhizobium ventifaucium TaxID=666020 RepID=A0ABM9DNT7_9HYPH|nr:hypothetical protein MES4922_20037 [Mesorhizobium ventifaucium]
MASATTVQANLCRPPLKTVPLSGRLYAQRHLVECCFSKLKQFRRVATRFEKTARNYRALSLSRLCLVIALTLHTA